MEQMVTRTDTQIIDAEGASGDLPGFMGIVGSSATIGKVFATIRKVARADSTVLITGESGTGKELIARAIHHSSTRKNGPMVVINCGAIPSELLESELFGHEKGSFTGAHRARMGRFEMANGGTIFLDEIGDMSPGLQVKLLRAIQEQSFERVGGTQPVKVDIRILSATNKDLQKAVKAGEFREDLYYRLNVIPIQVPPLRERKEDLPFLCRYFLKRLADRFEEKPLLVTEAAQELLLGYGWPGNVRELENLMERLAVMSEGDGIDVDDLPESIWGVKTPGQGTLAVPEMQISGIGFHEAVEIYQKRLIIEALNRTDWVKAKAATMLKMNRTTLVEKIKKLKITREEDIVRDLGLF